MKIHEKIRCMRHQKTWSQEQMAEKLGMTTQGYAKIERGEGRYMSKLEKIAEVLGVDLMELLTLGEKNIICFNIEDNHSTTSQFSGLPTDLAFEIQKLQLIIQHDKEMLAQKDKDIARLETIIELLKKTNQTE